MQTPQEAFTEWRRADAAARDAEQILASAWQAYDAGIAGPPAEELLQEVSRRRSVANDKLTQAMHLMQTRRR